MTWLPDTIEERVAVGRRLRRELGADRAAGAAAVVDDDLLAEALAHLRRDAARDDVDRAAGRERHDETDGFAGVVGRSLRLGSREREQAQDQRRPRLTSFPAP